MDIFKLELTKLVDNYACQKKLADEKFVEKALELCIKEFNVEDYVRDYDVLTISDMYAGYNIEHKNVIIDLRSCIDSAMERVNDESKSGLYSSEYLKYVKVNLNVLNSVIHELTHACQYKKCLEGEDDLEKQILELTLERNLCIIRKEPLTTKRVSYFRYIDDIYRNDELYYIAMPNERMANIKGLELESDVSKLLPIDNKGNIENYTMARLLLGKMQAYQECSPTAFIALVNEIVRSKFDLSIEPRSIKEIEKMYKELARKNNIYLDERIRLGLPIEQYEKEKILNKANKLRNGLLKRYN